MAHVQLLATGPQQTNPSQPPSMRFGGRPLIAARLLWLATVALAVAVFFASIPSRATQLGGIAAGNELSLSMLSLSSRFLVSYIVSLDGLVMAGCCFMALFIYWRRPDDRLTLTFSGMLVIYAITVTRPLDALDSAPPLLHVLADILRGLGQWLTMLFGFLFPNGRFVPAWTRRAALLWFGLIFAGLAFPHLPINMLSQDDVITRLLILVGYGLSVYSQIYRYRRVSTPSQQQQTKWVVLGMAMALSGATVFLLAPLFVPAFNHPGISYLAYIFIGVPFLYTAALALPISIGISILRYRLWDVDFIINRTVLYTALTGTLALIYFSSVIVLQELFRSLTGENRSQLVIVLSTLGIAALATPLRRHFQQSLDRRFYRRRVDAARALAAFGRTARDEVDLANLTAELLGIIHETVQPAHLSLWLRTPEK